MVTLSDIDWRNNCTVNTGNFYVVVPVNVCFTRPTGCYVISSNS